MSAVAVWAVGVVLLTFVEAIYRLGVRAARTIGGGLSPFEWAVLVVVVTLFCWGEGHRALQRRFAPRLVARALELGRKPPSVGTVLLAPIAALSLVGDERKVMARAWAGVALIVLAVVVVRVMPEPWRGIVDAGVCSALAWGFVAIVGELVRGLRRGVDHEEVVRGCEPVASKADAP